MQNITTAERATIACEILFNNADNKGLIFQNHGWSFRIRFIDQQGPVVFEMDWEGIKAVNPDGSPYEVECSHEQVAGELRSWLEMIK